MNQPEHIDREQLKSLLDENASVSIPPLLAQHLEECSHCRARLEQTAADPSWWSCLAELDDASLDSTYASPSVDNPLCGVGDSHGQPSVHRSGQEHVHLLDAPSHPEMLGQLQQFEIERVIGQGGMGVVFKGFDRELHRTVAIKLMSPHLAHNATARKRFEREARAAAAVVHPNVIPIHGVSLFKDQPLIVMPLIAGASLQAHVEQHGPIDTKDVVRIGMQIAAGLAAAHDQGLIHRDIKPANILLEQDVSRVVITDFGLARAADELAMTQTGWLAGTPHYMSPEQARGAAIDARSDLFSLGGVLYFIATGSEPFRAEKPIAVLHKICHDPAIPAKQLNSDIPQTLSNIIERLLEKNPQDRFASAARVQKMLEEYLAELQQPNRTQRPMRIITRRQIERRWRIAQFAALFALVIPLAAIAGWYSTKYFGPPASQVVKPETPPNEFPPSTNLPSDPPSIRPDDELDLQIRELDQEIQGFEQRMQWLFPSAAEQDPTSGDRILPNQGSRLRQVEPRPAAVRCEKSYLATSTQSFGLKSFEPIYLIEKRSPDVGQNPSLVEMVGRWLWERYLAKWSERISTTSVLLDN